MNPLTSDAGPDRAKIIRSALTQRLLRDHQIDPGKTDDIIAHAMKVLSVRMTPRGWAVTESDIARFCDDARNRPGWRKATPDTKPDPDQGGWSAESWAALSATERLRLANRGVKFDKTTGRYDTVIER